MGSRLSEKTLIIMHKQHMQKSLIPSRDSLSYLQSGRTCNVCESPFTHLLLVCFFVVPIKLAYQSHQKGKEYMIVSHNGYFHSTLSKTLSNSIYSWMSHWGPHYRQRYSFAVFSHFSSMTYPIGVMDLEIIQAAECLNIYIYTNFISIVMFIHIKIQI